MTCRPFRWRHCCPIAIYPLVRFYSPHPLNMLLYLLFWLLHTLYPAIFSSSSTTCLSRPSSQSVASSSSLSPSSPPPPSASQPLDFLSRFLVYPSSERLKAACALLHPWFVSRLDEVGLVLPVGYRASQPKVDCSQGVSADNYVENGAPLPQVEFSYERGGREHLTEVLISDDSVFWDHADDVLLSRLLGERMERQRHTVVQSLLQKCSMRRARILIQYPYTIKRVLV